VEPPTQVTEADLAPLRGIGATAIEQLRQALAAAGLSFAPRELNQAGPPPAGQLWVAADIR